MRGSYLTACSQGRPPLAPLPHPLGGQQQGGHISSSCPQPMSPAALEAPGTEAQQEVPVLWAELPRAGTPWSPMEHSLAGRHS